MSALRERILITVKTYPHPSRRYEETVCTAGLALGMGKLIRLYPIRFRELPFDQQFKKWDIIEAELTLRTQDARGDTYTPSCESMTVVDHVDTGSGGHCDWAARNRHVLPHVSTVEDLVRRAKDGGGSLGLVRVQPGAEMSAQAESDKWSAGQQTAIAQEKLFGKDLKPLEKVPWRFHYRFTCCPDCPEHEFTVLDWEPFALYRAQARRKGPEQAMKDVLRKYNGQYGVDKRDLHFFVGTTIDRQAQFSIIGVYYPPRNQTSDAPVPLRLFEE